MFSAENRASFGCISDLKCNNIRCDQWKEFSPWFTGIKTFKMHLNLGQYCNMFLQDHLVFGDSLQYLELSTSKDVSLSALHLEAKKLKVLKVSFADGIINVSRCPQLEKVICENKIVTLALPPGNQVEVTYIKDSI